MKPMVWLVLCTFGLAMLAAAQMRRGESAEEEVGRLDREVGEALTRRDAGRLRELIAEDFEAVNPQGAVLTREEAIAQITSPDYEVDSIVNHILSVRVFGEVALVRARGVAKGRYQGRDISAEFTYLRVWVRRAGKWRAVAAQATMAPTNEAK